MAPVASSLHAPEQALLDHLTQSVFLKDRDGRFVAVNRAFCAGLGRDRGDVLGRDDFAFYPRGLAEKYRADDLLILLEGTPRGVEEQNLQNGELRTVRVVKSPVRGADGRIEGILGIFWDITEQRRLENQLRQAQKMSAVAQLAGGIAHDFNNLLTVVLGNVTLAQLEIARAVGLDGDHIIELLHHAEAAGQRAAELTRQLLVFSRRLQPRPRHVLFDECIRHALTGVAIPAAIELVQRLEAGAALAVMDPGQMQQLLRQLIRNAHDAMPEGGTLTVQTQAITLVPESACKPTDTDDAAAQPAPQSAPQSAPQPAPPPAVEAAQHPESRAGEFVRLRVSDTGAGVSAEVLDHMFEPFFSTKGIGAGTGLGLAVAASIAKDHDGWLECHSAPGQGTRFDLVVPRLVAPLPAVARPPAAAATLVIIDNHEVVRNMGRDILERHGYRVLACGGGAPALELLRRHKDQIGLVIVDWMLSDFDGQTLLTELRLLAPEVPLLLCAAYPTGPAVRAVERCQAAGFVAKPFQVQELLGAVRGALEQAAVQRAPSRCEW
ncbi:MAG: PAS domain-containing protein [Gemmataceae bacterium]|nr:PAS domain-containing protein [Gemmataceae bacterium]